MEIILVLLLYHKSQAQRSKTSTSQPKL